MYIYNSLSRKKEEFKPVQEGKAGIYACGPTVYNYFHIGNARPFITFDVLRRQLEREGYDVTFVQNFTDIDDKMIRRANEEGITVKELAEHSGTSEATARRALNDAGIILGDKRAYEVKASLGLNKAHVDIKGLYISGSARAIVLRTDSSLEQTMGEGTLSTRNRELAMESGDNSLLADILGKMCVSKKENAVKEVKLDEFLKRTDDSLEGIKHIAVILSPKYRLPSGLLFKNMELITTSDEPSWLAIVAMCFRLMSEGDEGRKTFNNLERYIQSRTSAEESFVWTRDNLEFPETPLSDVEDNLETDKLFSGNSYSNCAWVKYGYATRDGEYAEFCNVKYDALPDKDDGIYADPYKVASYTGEVVNGVRSIFEGPQKRLAEEYMNQSCKKKQNKNM